jgi:hypothetical protein
MMNSRKEISLIVDMLGDRYRAKIPKIIFGALT